MGAALTVLVSLAPVRFENIFHEIRPRSQVLALEEARRDDGTFRFDSERTHALGSRFEWRVESG
jgi:hypothetical protein